MSDELAWLTSLPRLPDHDNAYVLVEGSDGRGGTVTVVGVPYEDSGYSVQYITSRDGELIEVAEEFLLPHFTPSTRTVHIGLEQIAGYIKGAASWAYGLESEVKQAVTLFLNAQLIDGDTWNDDAAAWYERPDRPYDTELPAGTGTLNLRERVHKPLLDYMYYVRMGDDPRELVLSVTREEFNGQDCLRLKIRRDVFRLVGSETVDRRLRAVLPGTGILQVDDDASEDFYNALVGNCETVLVRGTFDQEVWDELTEYAINSRLVNLPNDPVIRVIEGQYPLQVLLVLAYPPDEDELVYIQNCVSAATHAALAEPVWVYGTNVVSLLVPSLYQTVEPSDIEKTLRNDLVFVN